MLDGIGTIGTTKYSYEAPLSIRVVEVVVFRGMETTTSLVPASDGATPSVLLKTDVLGRVKHGPGQRERILDKFERSGVSGPKFAALAWVKYQTFATWM